MLRGAICVILRGEPAAPGPAGAGEAAGGGTQGWLSSSRQALRALNSRGMPI